VKTKEDVKGWKCSKIESVKNLLIQTSKDFGSLLQIDCQRVKNAVESDWLPDSCFGTKGPNFTHVSYMENKIKLRNLIKCQVWWNQIMLVLFWEL